MRRRRVLLLAVLLLAAAAVAGVAQPQLSRGASTPTAGRTITVTGNGSVSAVPDRATFGFGVQTHGATATGTLDANAKVAGAVVAALKALGVASADIRTTQVSLSPSTSQDGTRIVGYTAFSNVSVTAAIDRAGPLVDAAVRAGANSVSGPGLGLSQQDELYREALKKAVADARAKANALAAAAGLRLGKAQSVSEGSAPTPLPIGAKAGASTGVPIEPGTQEVDATVTVTYAAF